MCGIAGFCDFTKKSNKQTLVKMTDVLYHRGPDDSGYSFYENEFAQVGLGHRRLSILDLSSHGHQPMIFENLEIVYNGEVYNFREIAKELESYGYELESNSDTEVILKAFHRWGIQTIDKFIGMFAIVIYDKRSHKMIFIRDRAGVKPLYYLFKDGLFLFASELKSFHEHPRFSKEISLNALTFYFQFGYILEPNTIFQNAFKLPAGHYAELNLKNREFHVYQYWNVLDFYNKPKLNISFEEAELEVEKLLKSAIEYRMVSDVPVGIFLSGGYDSATVAALLQKDRTEKLKTFSIGFHEKKYNEAPFAKRVANYLGTDHTEYYCTQNDAAQLFPLMSEIWDEPFGDSSNIPTTILSHIARQNVNVSLSADGGDEIFGGYDKYTQTLKYFKIFSKTPSVFGKILEFVNPKYLVGINRTHNFENRYKKLALLVNAKNEIEIITGISYYFTPLEIRKILNEVITVKSSIVEDVHYLNTHNDSVDRMMAIDYKTYLLDDILVKVDRATMSVGLEGREPLLDHRIIEYVARLPSNFKINRGNKKHILKTIVHNYIPKKLMDRPKMGFSIPLNEWFGGELKKYVLEYLDSSKVAQTGMFKVIEIEKIKRKWFRDNNVGANQIWLLLTFMMWYERWMA